MIKPSFQVLTNNLGNAPNRVSPPIFSSMIDYTLYKRVMEFIVNYLGLKDRLLFMNVLRYDEVLNGVKVLIAVYQASTGEVVAYCAVKFDNAIGKAEPTCSRDEEYVRRVYEGMT